MLVNRATARNESALHSNKCAIYAPICTFNVIECGSSLFVLRCCFFKMLLSVMEFSSSFVCCLAIKQCDRQESSLSTSRHICLNYFYNPKEQYYVIEGVKLDSVMCSNFS